MLFCWSCNANGCGLTASFYSRMVEAECDDTLGESLDNQLDSLCQWTFGSKTLDNFQKSLTWQCH